MPGALKAGGAGGFSPSATPAVVLIRPVAARRQGLALTAEPLVCIVGPTAVGKTALAVALARQFGGEIINADSRQAYRGMTIGTAKPTAAEQAQARHHLVDVLAPSESFGLGRFLELARAALDEIRRRGRLPLAAGGTGQFVWALANGGAVPRIPPDPAFRSGLESIAEAEGPEALHRRLQQVDPARAAAIDPRNARRVIRALEIHRATGRRPSEFAASAAHRPTAAPLILGLTLERTALYQRIDERVDRMLREGLLQEVAALLQAGYLPGQGPMSSPGYRELGQHLRGEMTLEAAVARTKTQTHRLVRRQYTWFKLHDERIRWLDAAAPDIVEQAVAAVAEYLQSGG